MTNITFCSELELERDQPHLVFCLLVYPARQPPDPGERVPADSQHGAQRLPGDLPGAGQDRVN